MSTSRIPSNETVPRYSQTQPTNNNSQPQKSKLFDLICSITKPIFDLLNNIKIFLNLNPNTKRNEDRAVESKNFQKELTNREQLAISKQFIAGQTQKLEQLRMQMDQMNDALLEIQQQYDEQTEVLNEEKKYHRDLESYQVLEDAYDEDEAKSRSRKKTKSPSQSAMSANERVNLLFRGGVENAQNTNQENPPDNTFVEDDVVDRASQDQANHLIDHNSNIHPGVSTNDYQSEIISSPKI